MNKLAQANKKIEDAVVSGYKAIETGVVIGYKKIEDRFVKSFLTDANGNRIDQKQPVSPAAEE